jgi:thermostable 8-oxoguanine DNA glycosylase
VENQVSHLRRIPHKKSILKIRKETNQLIRLQIEDLLERKRQVEVTHQLGKMDILIWEERKSTII